MKKFEDIFDKWLGKKIKDQISIIDDICSKTDVDPDIWFKSHLRKNLNDYSGADFTREMLSDFIFYLTTEIERQLLRYFEPDGTNIYGGPYLSIDWELNYHKNKLCVEKNEKKNFKKKLKVLTVDQKLELMKNKLFSYVVNQTNLKIYSKKDIRVLKLKNLNEYNEIAEE